MHKKIVAGYCRAATLVASRRETIPKQKALLNRLAKRHGLVIDRFYEDCGYSGRTLKLPELKKLLKECKAGSIDTVLVTDLDRIAQYADLVIKVLKKLKKYRVRVLAGEEYDLRN